MPLPPLPLPMNPAFVTVRIARPVALRRTASGIACSGISWKRLQDRYGLVNVVLHARMHGTNIQERSE
jgi:hypothetical protein